MYLHRKADERGNVEIDWLKSKHSFSFGHYYDARYMGFGPLRVINEDRITPSAGFPTHGHADMEIISYVISGALEHKDTEGNHSIIRPGEVQRMRAGTGIHHSEYNAMDDQETHFLQIWIIPDERGLKPDYAQIAFPTEERHDKWRLVGSQDGRDGSVHIHQDVNMLASNLSADKSLDYTAASGRGLYLQIVRGAGKVGETEYKNGDGFAFLPGEKLNITASEDSELVLFDMILPVQ